jgi:hypothetical protein
MGGVAVHGAFVSWVRNLVEFTKHFLVYFSGVCGLIVCLFFVSLVL